MNTNKCIVMIDELQKELSNMTKMGSSDPIVNDSLKCLQLLQIELEQAPQERHPTRFHQLEANVIDWAHDRGIFKELFPTAQFLKFISEVGEAADHVAAGDEAAIVDDIGDILVTLIIFTRMLNLELDDCLEVAWNEIRGRTGKMVNGVFIKD